MTGGIDHLIIAPILLPLIVGALMLLFDERRRRLKQVLGLATTVALFIVALVLFQRVSTPEAGALSAPQVYLLGNWPAPFGIVLVVDRLSALMLLLTSILGFTSLFYALARWDRAGPRFHALFLFLLMGLNGAFLTGDVFNLFVFFEVLLAASYGLALHGAGSARTKASLHYITINVATSLLFLIGVSMIYAATGTLNMADLARRAAETPAEDLVLLQSGAAILGIAFLVKAGMWPLSFWLPTTYAAASAPVAAIFAIMSKVGIYVILRLSSLLFGDQAGSAGAGFADAWLTYAGVATVAFGMVALLSSQVLTRIAGYYVLISSGTLLAALGAGSLAVTSGALFYLVSSTLAVSALYLIIEPVERNAQEEESSAISEPVFNDEYIGALVEEENEIGVVIPATIAVLGGGFIFCALLLSGMPPLSGFLAKFAIIDGFLGLDEQVDASVWILIALIILSGLAVLITMTRVGIDILWTPADRPQAKLSIVEAVPIGILLSVCVALAVGAGPVMSYMEKTAQVLSQPELYMDAVGQAAPAGARR